MSEDNDVPADGAFVGRGGSVQSEDGGGDGSREDYDDEAGEEETAAGRGGRLSPPPAGRRRRHRRSGGGGDRYRQYRRSASSATAETGTPPPPPPPLQQQQQGQHEDEQHDDTVGHYRGGPGSVIRDRYEVLRDVGVGTFGRVVECLDLDARQQQVQQRQGHRGPPPPQPPDALVAIKVVRNVKRYCDSALIEARIIEDVNRRGGRGLTHCVILHDSFTYRGHYCMVFESLGPSLYDWLKEHRYQPFPMGCIQDFAVQLLEALEFLHSFRLIHTDLKIENVLLMNDRETAFGGRQVPQCTRIKVSGIRN